MYLYITARLRIDQPLLVLLGYTHWSGHPRHHYHISIVDGFQMSKKRATSGGKTHNQKARVWLTFHFQKTSLLLVLVVRIRWIVPCLYCAHSCTERTHHSCPPEVKPRPMLVQYSWIHKLLTNRPWYTHNLPLRGSDVSRHRLQSSSWWFPEFDLLHRK